MQHRLGEAQILKVNKLQAADLLLSKLYTQAVDDINIMSM